MLFRVKYFALCQYVKYRRLFRRWRFKFGTSTHLLTYLLTYSMVQSPSWEANRFAASQEIPRILWDPKVHYRTHKLPPPVPILGQPNPVHIPTSHLLEIHPNVIHPFTPRSPQWSLSLRFPHQDPIRPPLLTHTRHMPSPSHSSRFYHPHNIGWGVQTYLEENSHVTLMVYKSDHVPSDFRLEVLVDDNCAIPSCYAARSWNSLPTFRDNLSVPYSRVKNSGFLTVECGTDRLFRNVGEEFPPSTA